MTTALATADGLTRALVPTRPDWLDHGVLPFRSRFLSIDGATLHYVDEGAGPPVLLIAGSPLWSFTFRLTIARLQSSRRVIAVDLPGLGLGEAPLLRGRAFEANADWLGAFVCFLDLRELVVVAHATAGPSALAMAASMPRRIAGLCLSNTFAWPLDGPLGRIVRVVSSWPFRAVNATTNLLPRVTANKGRRTGRFDDAERAAILGPFHERGPRRHLNNLLFGLRAERPFFAGLEEKTRTLADRPSLLLYGAHDNGRRAGHVERMKALLPDARVAILPESAHFLVEDEPERFDDALSAWLDAAF